MKLPLDIRIWRMMGYIKCNTCGGHFNRLLSPKLKQNRICLKCFNHQQGLKKIKVFESGFKFKINAN